MLVNIEPDFMLPDSLKTIEDEAFMNGAFRRAVLSEQTEYIGANAFAGCRDLLCICIPNGTIQIDDQAFGDLNGIVISGISGGTAEIFAQTHGCFFIPID